MKEVRTEAKGTGTWEVITPEKACEMLKHNTNNYRIIKRKLVVEYSRAMREGAWEENGQPIVFDEDGVLKDGQHRLLAVMASGVSVRMFGIRGIKRDVVVYDEGMKRTGADHARAAGVQADNRAIALARYMTCSSWNENARARVSNYRVLFDYIEAHSEEIDTVIKSAALSRQVGAGSINRLWGYIVLYMLLRNGYDAEKMRQFCTIFNGGYPEANVEATPALVASRQYADNPPHLGKPTKLHEAMANLACAMEDFADGMRRFQKYQFGSSSKWTPEKLEALWHKIRQEDGIE